MRMMQIVHHRPAGHVANFKGQMIVECSGELGIYLHSLWSNFQTHDLFFHDETGNVQRGLDNLGSLAHHINHNMQKMTIDETITCSQNLQKDNSPHLNDFCLFVPGLVIIYSVINRRHTVATKSYCDQSQHNYNANVSEPSYANWLPQNLREAEWDEVHFQSRLHNMINIG